MMNESQEETATASDTVTASDTTDAITAGDAAVIHDQRRCSVANCPVKGQTKYRCSNVGCNKFVHLTCYVGLIINKNQMQPLPDDLIACTKKCYKETNNRLNPDDNGDLRNTWECDGLNGKDDPHHSMKLLLDWWTTQGNYEKYRGKNNNGTKKVQYAEALAKKMKNETRSTDRTAKQVTTKISALETAWKKAHEWATGTTGVGLQESDNPNDVHSFEDYVLRKCKYYRTLYDVMIDRAANEPRALSYDKPDTNSIASDDFHLSNANDFSDDDDVNNDANGEEEAEGADGAEEPTVPPIVTAAAKRKRGSATSISSNVGSVPVADSIEKASNLGEKRRSQQLAETARHNRLTEKVAEDRFAWEKKAAKDRFELDSFRFELDNSRFNWEKEKYAKTESVELASAQLRLKSEMLAEYNKMKQQGLTDDIILAIAPELQTIVEAMKK